MIGVMEDVLRRREGGSHCGTKGVILGGTTRHEGMAVRTELRLHLVVVGQPVGLQLVLRPDDGQSVGPAVLTAAHGRGAAPRHAQLAP